MTPPNKDFDAIFLYTLCLTLSQTTNFRLLQIQRVCKMTISNLMKTAESSPKGKKTLGEKEKLLVASNFSFSHSVLKRLVLKTVKKPGLVWKGLTIYHTIPSFNPFPDTLF